MANYSWHCVSTEMLEVTKKATEENHFVDRKPLEAKLYNNATIYPSKNGVGGVIDENGNGISSVELFNTHEINKYVAEKKECISKAIYIGYLHDVWGHIFTDCFKMLWYLLSDDGQKYLSLGYRVVYVAERGRELSDVVFKFISLLGIDTSLFYRIHDVTEFKTLIVPEECFSGKNLCFRTYTREYHALIDTIRNRFIDNQPDLKKVYFSERHFNEKYRNRKSIFSFSKSQGEKDIERVFSRLGYEIIFPDELSVEEQIKIVVNCECFAATEGSISHIAVFCAPQTDVSIIRKINRINPYQIAINNLANLNVTYIDANCSNEPMIEEKWWAGPFYLCINDSVVKYVGHKLLYWPYCLRLSWLWYKNHNRKIVHRFCKIIGVTIDLDMKR